MGAHEDSVLAHIPYRWSYANAAARTGAGGFVAGDVGKFARQTDNDTIWMLIATTPTWILIGGGDSSDLPYTPADVNDWDYLADPGNVPDALDQLADRVTWLESVAVDVTLQVLFSVEGVLTVASNPIRIYNNYGATKTISKVALAVNTAPTGAAIIVDVNKGGTTIFTNQAHRPQIAASANTGNTTDIDVASWADGQYLTIDVDQIGSTIAGSNLTVHIIFS